MLFTCPACKQTLHRDNTNYACANNHRFDAAKEGYVNLLLAQKKRSKNPGDDNTMMACRHAFLNAGYYDFLADALGQTIHDHALNTSPSPLTLGKTRTLLDIGCGEGFYGHKIKVCNPQLELAGIDIAKGGVRLSAKRKTHTTSNNTATLAQSTYHKLAVASAYDLPFEANSMDYALSVFSPIDMNEIAKVLKSGSVFIAVGPAKNHLQGLAEEIYDTFKPHKNGFTDANQHSEFKPISHQVIEQTTTITGSDIYNLLTMTPYYWSTSEQKQQAIKALKTLSTPLAFEINTYQCIKN